MKKPPPRTVLPMALALALGACGNDSPTDAEMPEPAFGVGATLTTDDGQVVIVSADGTRFVYFDPSDGSFSEPEDVDQLEVPGLPYDAIGAATHDATGTLTYFVDGPGLRVITFDRTAESFGPDVPVATAFAGLPFTAIGAMYTTGTYIVVFEKGGTRYAEYNTVSDTWTPILGFLQDFGRGEATIVNVGAAYATEVPDEVVLFDRGGNDYTIISASTFSEATSVGDLGDGTLTTPAVPEAAPTVGAVLASGSGPAAVVSGDGTRFAFYDWREGTFSDARNIDEIEGPDLPFEAIGATAHDNVFTPNETYYVDLTGLRVTVFDRDTETFGAELDLPTAFPGIPLTSVGAMLTLGTQVFMFDREGSAYAAYLPSNETWSPVYDFSTDFGGGGGPIDAVGAAYASPEGYVLFDTDGDVFTIYIGSGRFSAPFETTDYGDGTLDF